MLLAAGCLIFVLGLVHSLLGERLIFRHLRDSGIIPTKGGDLLEEKQLRILWASWHLVTIFGWGIGAILCGFYISSTAEIVVPAYVINSVALSIITSAAIVLFATKGKHPAWVVLTVIAVLVLLA